MRGVISPSAVDTLRDSIAATVQKHSTSLPPKGYVGGLLRMNQDIAEHLANPRLLKVCEHLFGKHSRISTVTGSVNAPGTPRGDMHVDWPHNQGHESCIHVAFASTLAHLVAFVMLTDFTSENGGTAVIPGSHRWDPGRCPTNATGSALAETEERLLGKAGDVGLLDARTWHSIAPNRSNEPRVAVIVRYAPWWLNLNPLRKGSRDRRLMVKPRNAKDPHVMPISLAQFEQLPAAAKPLLHAMVDDADDPSSGGRNI